MPSCRGRVNSSSSARLSGSIEIASWSLGASNPTSVGSAGMSAGKVSFSDLSVMISLEKASVELLSRVCNGKVIKKATLYGRKAGDDKRQDYLKVTLQEVMVSSWQTSASGAPISVVRGRPHGCIGFEGRSLDASRRGCAKTRVGDRPRARNDPRSKIRRV